MNLLQLNDPSLTALLTFLDGKGLSTMLIVSKSFQRRAMELCRSVLVEQYRDCVETLFGHNPEISDVLIILRDDIRSYELLEDTSLTQFSEWCAIFDFLTIQYRVTRRLLRPQYIVWKGQLGLDYGDTNCFLVTPHFSIGAMEYWLALENQSLAVSRPRHSIVQLETLPPYGTLFGSHDMDRRRLGRQSGSIQVVELFPNVRNERWVLVDAARIYEARHDFLVADHSYVSRAYATVPVPPLLIAQGRQSLCVCFDQEVAEDDWDTALSRFGSNAIRIMKSFDECFEDSLVEYYRNLSEFTNTV